MDKKFNCKFLLAIYMFLNIYSMQEGVQIAIVCDFYSIEKEDRIQSLCERSKF